MRTLLILLALLLLSVVTFAQVNNTSDFVNSQVKQVDSCLIFEKLLKKEWIYVKKGNYFIDSSGILRNKHLYPAFKNCLLNKSRKNILKLLKYPSNSGLKSDTYIYCLSSNNDPSCCYEALYIRFNKRGKVISSDIFGCELSR